MHLGRSQARALDVPGSTRPTSCKVRAQTLSSWHYLTFVSRGRVAETVKVPQMAESISEGTLKTWLKKPGDVVQADEEIATIETDKVCFLAVVVARCCVPVQHQGNVAVSCLPVRVLSMIWTPLKGMAERSRFRQA